MIPRFHKGWKACQEPPTVEPVDVLLSRAANCTCVENALRWAEQE